MVWKPMVSAPLDGRRFVAGLWVGQGSAARFEMHIIRADMQPYRVHPDDDHGWAWSDYTHCLELPLPSAAGTAEAGIADAADGMPTPMQRAYGVS